MVFSLGFVPVLDNSAALSSVLMHFVELMSLLEMLGSPRSGRGSFMSLYEDDKMSP